MNVGLFFGSFNPVHVGHLIIANLVYEQTEVDEVWFVVSPQNPLKKSRNLAHEFDRIDMVREAIDSHAHLRATDIEFGMTKPSYTSHTLAALTERYPHHTFRVILGEDNLTSFKRWKNHEHILDNFGLIVYPRPETSGSTLEHPNIVWIEAPKMAISATHIRQLIKEGKSPKYLVPDTVLEIIESRKLYF